MNTNLTDLFNLKNLLNTSNDQTDQSSKTQSISKKKLAAKAAPAKTETEPITRAEIPILQLYVKADSESKKPSLSLADNNEHNADENKFYPLVSSDSVIMDSQKWCATIRLYQAIISAYGSYILTNDQINSINTQLDKYLADEETGKESKNIFYVIDLINGMLKQTIAAISFMSQGDKCSHLKSTQILSKGKWVKSTDTNMSYYTYDIDLSKALNQLKLSDSSHTFDFAFSIAPHEECTSNYNQSNISGSVTTNSIRSENIANMLIFSDYGITKIDEDIQNKKITVMAKKKPDIDITISIMIIATEVAPV